MFTERTHTDAGSLLQGPGAEGQTETVQLVILQKAGPGDRNRHHTQEAWFQTRKRPHGHPWCC